MRSPQQRAGIAELASTAQGLREALASSKTRGQWGERMAEDVLRLAGFVEGVQYRKQKAVEQGTGIPDFTFLLPQDAILYMDVKFPLDNYVRYVNAETELEQARFRDDFVKDVKAKVKELAQREYPRGSESSVDCVLLFIPNEQLYAFVQEHADALARRRPARAHRDVLAAHAVRGARGRAPGGRELPHGAHRVGDPRRARHVPEAVGRVQHQDGRARAQPHHHDARVRRARRGPDPAAGAPARPHRRPPASPRARRDR